jgi:hypothetical protein
LSSISTVALTECLSDSFTGLSTTEETCLLLVFHVLSSALEVQLALQFVAQNGHVLTTPNGPQQWGPASERRTWVIWYVHFVACRHFFEVEVLSSHV